MKSIKTLCAIFALLISTLCAQTTIDSKTAGRAFARDMWDSYDFYGAYTFDEIGSVRYDFNGKMDLYGRIVALNINGKLIVGEGDTPLPGLPYVDSNTMPTFWLSLNAKKGGQQVAYGYVHRERLRENESVTVILYPSDEVGFFNYNHPGSDQLRLVDEDGRDIGWYDIYLKGFRYSLDSLGGPVTAFVVSGGRRISSFVLDPFESPEISGDNLINVDLIGGVIRVMMNQYGYANQNTTTDGQTEVQTESGPVLFPAKVFLIDTEGDYFQVGAYNEKGAGLRMEIYDVGEGRFDLIHSADFQKREWNEEYDINYLVPSGYSTIMVVIVDSTRSVPRPFSTFFTKGKEGRG